MAINHFIDRANRVINTYQNYRQVISEVVVQNESVLLELQKSQILAGLNKNGEYFSPTYSQDNYFKSVEKANRYAAFKGEIGQGFLSIYKDLFPSKPFDVPDLRVVGVFQDSIYIKGNSASLEVGATYRDSEKINSKYGNTVLGENEISRMYFFYNYIVAGFYKKWNV